MAQVNGFYGALGNTDRVQDTDPDGRSHIPHFGDSTFQHSASRGTACMVEATRARNRRLRYTICEEDSNNAFLSLVSSDIAVCNYQSSL